MFGMHSCLPYVGQGKGDEEGGSSMVVVVVVVVLLLLYDPFKPCYNTIPCEMFFLLGWFEFLMYWCIQNS